MRQDLQLIKNKFESIKELGWVESKRKGNTGIGYTLEKLFELHENNFEIPDFVTFELKAHRTYSKSYITLFNATPDGDYLFEIDHLKQNYGYPDKVLKQYKILNCDMFSNKINDMGSVCKQTIKVDYKERKVRLYIMDNSLKLIDKEVSWSFEMLKEKFERKLKYIVLISADKKRLNNTDYFKYNNLIFYKSLSFDRFIKLIDKGIIRISFKIGIFRSGKRLGQTHDHGTGFSISEKNIPLLFETLFE